MTELLRNHLCGRWVAGTGDGTTLRDPISGAALVRVSGQGVDLASAVAYARDVGGAALRALGYGPRAAMLGSIAKALTANRDAYFEIATANSGTTRADSAMDIDGAIYTVSQYARWGAALGEARALSDGSRARLGKDGSFQSQHVLVPTRGVALLINAFNFPAWGLWEKAAPALLSGVPVLVKPATATAWLAHRMVADVLGAGVLPDGALSIVCGTSAGLLDPLQPFDRVSFTGSGATAAQIRAHRAITERSVPVNVEADSLNAALLLPQEDAGSPAFGLLVREVVREMTVKSGQKCTAIRRVLVPERLYDAAAGAVAAQLAPVAVGNPRNEEVRMGALVSRAQLESVTAGVARLRAETDVIHDGGAHRLVDADPSIAACVGPTLLGARQPDRATLAHDIEVFGPVCTLMPYRDLDHAFALVRRGGGSLVTSLYGSDPGALAAAALELADTHGRVHVVSPAVAESQTGHGNVMPQSLHGGPGRAGGGEELGGLRALTFYHRRAAVQAEAAVLDRIGAMPSIG
ncbi:MAG TPA: 3,4-dehydroadipyl-CoA semialdehyde dehydrogenase [Polyangiaceae bacterium]|nr:3,4-dehydroadipyl-CoA semialdehyde dehydrogenase [Polyangiaceae bacterium]